MGKRGRAANTETNSSADKYTPEHAVHVAEKHLGHELRAQEVKGTETAAVLEITRPFAEVNDHDRATGTTVRQSLVGIITGKKGTYALVHASTPLPGITMARHETLVVTSLDTVEVDTSNEDALFRSSSIVFSEQGNEGALAVDVDGIERFAVQYDPTQSESQVTIFGDASTEVVVTGVDPAVSNADLSEELGDYWAASPQTLREYVGDIYAPYRIV